MSHLTLTQAEADAHKRMVTDSRKVKLEERTKPTGRPKGRKESKPRKNVPTETVEQQNLISWWDVWSEAHGVDHRTLFSIPNGSHKSPAAAMKFKREGLRKGVPDLMLARPSGGFSGLFIELKRLRGSTTSPEQLEMIQLLLEQGYRTVVCKGFEAARVAIEEYLE